MNPTLEALLKERAHKYPHSLETHFPRVLEKIMNVWGTPQAESYFSELFFIDDKGGSQGFPPEVMSEIFYLSTLHDETMRARQNRNNDDVWSDESVRRELEEEHTEYSPRGFFKALDAGNMRAVRIFLDAGVDLELKNAVGWTPLLIAAFAGSEEAVTLLINAGADINARDNRGYAPLHWATYQGFVRVTDLLVQKGAFVNIRSDKGLTPLLQASARGHAAIVRFLISGGAAVNEPDQEGWTPLHKAVANGLDEIVAILMEAHADPYSRHENGLTPMDIARQKGNQAIIRRLVR